MTSTCSEQVQNDSPKQNINVKRSFWSGILQSAVIGPFWFCDDMIALIHSRLIQNGTFRRLVKNSFRLFVQEEMHDECDSYKSGQQPIAPTKFSMNEEEFGERIIVCRIYGLLSQNLNPLDFRF